MEMLSACVLPVGWIVWQSRSGGASLTVVCKATYALCPGESPLADEQDPLNEPERFRSDDPRRTLLLPSDLAPFKRRADVLLTGHAYGPGGKPARALVARLRVGEVDKSIETSAENGFAAVGFGPIAPTSTERIAKLGRHAATWDHQRWHEHALPDDIDASYFNAARPDQQVEAIRPSERIVLENLDPEHPRLVTNLLTATPRATVEWPNRSMEDIGFRCDTLWIDTDRRRCSLTWRAAIPLLRGEEPTRITLRIGGSAAREEPRARPDVIAGTTTRVGADGPRPALPFQAHGADIGSPAPPRASGSLLFGSVLGELRLGAPGAVIEDSPLDLDAETIDGTSRGFLDELTEDHWEPSQSTVDVMPFGSPSPLPSAFPPLAPQPVWLPEPSCDAPPAPPPMLGPLATPEMSAPRDSASLREPLSTPPPAEASAPPVETAPALPTDRFPIGACARIAASIARRRKETSAILGERELGIEGFTALEKHWAEAVSEESLRGKTSLLRAYDEAYVAQLQDERGVITPREYARLVLAVERGRAEDVLTELDLPRGAILRIQRVWLNRFAADAAFNKSVRAAMAAETEGEE